MEREKSINYTVESIKIIERQIDDFTKNKPLFFQYIKLSEYNKKIEKLENVRKYLYKKLEYQIDNND